MSRWRRLPLHYTTPILLPSPYPHENRPYAPPLPRRPSLPWWAWVCMGAALALASTGGWMVARLEARWQDQWQTVRHRLDDQVAQRDTQQERLDHHAVLLAEALQVLDRHASAIALNARQLDAHADEFVVHIAQLADHATQLTTHQQLLHTQSQMLTRQATQLRQGPSPATPVSSDGPPVLEVLAPLHTPAAAAPAAPRQIIRLPRDLGSVSRKGGQP